MRCTSAMQWLVPVLSLTLLTGCPEKKEPPVTAAPPQEIRPEPFPESQVPPPEPMPAPTVTTMNQPTPAPAPPPPPPPVAAAPVDTGVYAQPAPRPQPRESYEEPARKAPRTYTVRKNDTLQKISQKFYGTPNKWRRIYEANRRKIGNDPDKLAIGTKLVIP